jgi:hypothetical protein
MIGWVPYVLSEFLAASVGEELRRDIIREAGFDPDETLRINKVYADASCRRILDASCRRLGMSEEDAFTAFAPFFLARSRAMFPGFFLHRPTVRAFLLHQPEVHNTLAAGLQEGQRSHVADKFRVEALPGGVRVFYRSSNRLAGLYAAVARQLGVECGQATEVRFEAGTPADAECVMLVSVEEG